MAPEKKSLYEDAIALLERINADLKGHNIDTLNSRMIGVVKDLNEIRIVDITGKSES